MGPGRGLGPTVDVEPPVKGVRGGQDTERRTLERVGVSERPSTSPYPHYNVGVLVKEWRGRSPSVRNQPINRTEDETYCTSKPLQNVSENSTGSPSDVNNHRSLLVRVV